MMRIANWDLAVRRWAKTMVGRPFVWGSTDCHALVLAAYEVMYGVALPGAPRWASFADGVGLYDDWAPAVSLPRLGAVLVGDRWAARVGDVLVEPRGDRPFDGMLVALGDGRALTSGPAQDTVVVVDETVLAPGTLTWRWHDG